jgi:outer membrane biosynthesis protein TonB
MNQRIEQQNLERKNQRKALVITIVVQGLIFLLFWYAKIWSAEEMKLELPEPGFEVNYGTDDEGGGNVQSYNQPSDLQNNDESQPAEKETEVATVTKAKPTPSSKESVVTSVVKSPVSISENSKKTTTVATKPTPEPEEKIDEGALFKKKTTSNGTRGTNPNPGGNSNGPDAGKIGDKGSPNGKINNSTNYSGNGSGSGDGAGSTSVNISGWRIANRPNVKDDTGETGMIRFTIKIDEDGNIIKLVIAENSFSNSLAQKYKRAIEKSKFIKTSSGPSPKEATGSITFRVGER